MLAAMFHFSVASHYCGGIEVATRVSVTGKLAECGMENPTYEIPVSGAILSRHCCDNNLNVYGVYSNYVPAFSSVLLTNQTNFQVFAIPADFLSSSPTPVIPLHTDTSPPGTIRSTDVDLSGICVFRI